MRARNVGVLGVGALLGIGCQFVAGITGDLKLEGTGGAGGSSTSSTVSSSGMGGDDGGVSCTPNEVTSCYEGPAGTETKGLCMPGTHTCAPDGKSYGPCNGQVTPAVESCAVSDDENCDGFDCGIWATFISPSTMVTASAIAPNGDIILAATFTGTISVAGKSHISAGDEDILLLKLDPSGAILWSKSFGAALDQVAAAVTVDAAGDIFMTGSSASAFKLGPQAPTLSAGAYAARLDPSGEHIWSKSPGGGRGVGISVQNGYLIAAGSFFGSINWGDGSISSASPNSEDVFLAKLSSDDGSIVQGQGWVKRYGGAGKEALVAIKMDSSESITMVGTFDANTSFDSKMLPNAGMLDVFLVRVDPNGLATSAYGFGDAADQGVSALDLNSKGDPIITGFFNGVMNIHGTMLDASTGKNMYVANAAPGGGWARNFGKFGSQLPRSVAVDASDDVFILSDGFGGIDFGGGPFNTSNSALFLAKLSKTGDHLWSKAVESTTGSQAGATCVFSPQTQTTLITGSVSGSVTIGTLPFNADGAFVGMIGY